MTRNQEPAPSFRLQILLAIALFALIVFSRVLIELPNFKPVMAVAMLSGFLFHHKALGWLTIASGMLMSDFLIGFYDWRVSLVVYTALMLPMLGGLLLRRWRKQSAKLFAGVLGFAGLSAVLFYVSTTLAVWLCYPWYGKDIAGLFSAFAYGLPFFKWTVAGNVLFSLMLFGLASFLRSLGNLFREWRNKWLVPVKVRRP